MTKPVNRLRRMGGAALADRRPAVRDQAGRLGFEVVTPRDLLRSSGTLHRTMRVPGLVMYARNVTFTMSRAHARTLIPPVLDLISAGRLQPELVTTTLDSLDNALSVLREHFLSAGTKAILTA